MNIDLRLLLIVIILSILLLLYFLISLAVFRRVSHARKYKELDKQKDIYNGKISGALRSGQILQGIAEFSAPPGSVKWQAIEAILLNLIQEKEYKDDVKKLFGRLGYVSFYEKQLRRNIIVRSSAIDKLGKMLSDASVARIAEHLKDNNPEVIAVSIRALSRIGNLKGLKSILELLPHLVENELVARKTIETFLVNFGRDAAPLYLECGRKSANPRIIAYILEILSNLDDKRALPFAGENLKSTEPEVRSKALKAIGKLASGSKDFDGNLLMPLLEDPVWFVRLQAAKVLGKLLYEKSIDTLAGLLLDDKWQVRNAAATALTKFGDISLDIFLKALRYNDQYARESICEELERTNYVYRLIENLASDNREIYSKSREILNIMHSMNFVTPMAEYLREGSSDKIINDLGLILGERAKT
ncbi:MAG: HEAT repeat domain-containing protein [Nitrospirota bacterium]|nr:HEAT repeat domain-containing protein [Nitrospirota bacterium]